MSLVNPYDKAHELARALVACEEFKAFQKALAVMKTVPDAEAKMSEFMQKQMMIDFQRMQGGETEINPEQVAAMSKEYQELAAVPEIREFMNAERAFTRIFTDVQGIIQKAISIEQ